jgi:large repetitive protein
MRLSFWLLLGLLLGLPIPLVAQFVTNNSASNLGGDCYRLTSTVPGFQTGSVWYLNKVNIEDGFDLYFDVFLGCNDGGADGIAFVLQPISTGIGTAGEGLGYEGVNPSLAIEIDTWQNTNRNDPAYDHLALQSNGVVDHGTPENLAGPVLALPGGANIEDCQAHSMRVFYRAGVQLLQVYMDCSLRLSYSGDIVNQIFGGDPEVFWGFTGATGGFVNEQRFCLDYISFTEDLPDTAICLGESVQLFAGSGDSFLWTPGTGLDDPTIASPIATPSSTTTYVAQITDVCGQVRTDTVTISVTDTLPPFPPESYTLCNNGVLPLDASIPFGEVYTWSDGFQGAIRPITQPGSYQVSIQYPCSTLTRTFTVNSPIPLSISTDEASCHGAANGTATVTTTGNAPYSYRWFGPLGNLIRNTSSTSSPQDQANNLAAGSYLVAIANADGCLDTLSFVIQEPPPFSLFSSSVTDVACGGQATGVVSLQANGGTPPYQYRRGGGPLQSNNTFTNLAAGSYVFTVVDANGCETTTQVAVAENDPLLLQVDATTDILCAGDSTGAIETSAAGGIPGYQFTVSGFPSLPANAGGDFSGLAAGSYFIVVTDWLGCQDSMAVTLSEPAPLSAPVISQANVDCAGNSTGRFTVAGNGGVAPYQYAFAGGPLQNDSSWSGLSAGAYALLVQDANGCQTPSTVSITEPLPLQAQVDSLQGVDCYGNATGVAFLGASGGSAPFEYALVGSSFDSLPAIDSLSAGSYLFVVRDDSSCLDTVGASITEPDSLAAAVTNRVDVDCLGSNTGELSVAGSGGTMPYEYAINNGPFGASANFDSLFANFFTLYVRDANGCLASVDTLIATPTGLSAGIVAQIDVACHGDSTGSLLLDAQGGTGPYRYTYDLSTFTSNPFFDSLYAHTDTITLFDANDCIVPIPYSITQPDPLSASIAEQADVACHGDSSGFVRLSVGGGVAPYQFVLDGSAIFTDTLVDGLTAGPHVITVIDDSACTFEVNVAISEPQPLSAQVVEQKNIDCFGRSNGAVALQANGGVPSYQFALDTAAFDTLSRFDSLPAGPYLITVQDDSACTFTLPVQITQPDSLTLDTVQTVDIACFGDRTGELTLLAGGGVGAYQFVLDSGVAQSDSFFVDLPAGSYQLTVIDDSACTASLSVSLSEPPPLTLALTAQQHVDCYGNDNGRLRVSASGGQPNYQFQLNQNPPGPDSAFAELTPGSYRIEVSDANGCTQLLDSLSITEPDSLRLAIRGTDVRCHGGRDGQAEAILNGGTQPFTVDWNSDPPQTGLLATGLPMGSYRVEVVDANGCPVSGSVAVEQPTPLAISLVEQTDAFCDWDNGAATVAARGGLGGYTFAWSGLPGLSDSMAHGLLGGQYLVSVMDGNGCTDSLDLSIGNTPPPTAAFSTFPPTDGGILLSQADLQFINESAGAVAYEWDFGDDSPISQLTSPQHRYEAAGTYTVLLTAYNDFFLCPTTAELTFEIRFDGAVYAGNAFTPNGDGLNDVFPILHAGVVSGSWAVYSRWGREIRRFASIEDSWDGRMQDGRPAPEGAYVFVVKARLNSGAEVEQSGSITLIR